MKIIIPGKPIPLKRHRHTKSGRTYNSQKKEMVDVSFIIKSQFTMLKPYSFPLRLNIAFFMPIPKDKNKLYGLPHYKRPDIDNLCKFYMDCLVMAGSVITDDSIISNINATKLYSDNPRTEIDIYAFY